jgi:hypothetical protein
MSRVSELSERHLRLGHMEELATHKVSPYALPLHHLTTHCVVFGATNSGKTGNLMVLTEEALRSGVPVLMIDVKGDLPNLALAFPNFSAAAFEPWVEPAPGDKRGRATLAADTAKEREEALQAWGIGVQQLQEFSDRVGLRVITPGSNAGESLDLLSSLQNAANLWRSDPESARASLSAAISLVLRLLGLDPDPAKSRAHVLLSLFAEHRIQAGQPSDLCDLLRDLLEPPIAEAGALPINQFMSRKERESLAAALNTLLASPTFAAWRQGAPLEVGRWLEIDRDGKVPAVIVSVAHLEEEERVMVLGVLFEEVLSWVRSLPGTKHLRALVVFDEVFGFIPPHPANPATKQPLVSLMKQARAYGVGLVLATQNPMDIDYRVLSNAGIWLIGRLQTDADRKRVVEGLAETTGGDEQSAASLTRLIKRLAPRWFVMRNTRASQITSLLQPRWAMSYLRGPMTTSELRRLALRRQSPHVERLSERIGAQTSQADAVGALS